MDLITSHLAASALPFAGWDLKTFFDSAKTYATTVGGSIIMLLGVLMLIWAGVMIFKKVTSNGQGPSDSILKIAVTILIGGAMSLGGFTLITQVASGGQTTITDLGGGAFYLSNLLSIR